MKRKIKETCSEGHVWVVESELVERNMLISGVVPHFHGNRILLVDYDDAFCMICGGRGTPAQEAYSEKS